MPKDFTDYYAFICEWPMRAFHIQHFRAKDTKDQEIIEHRGLPYVFQRDWSYLIKWAPWRKWDSKHPIKSLIELFRAKKIGALFFDEPHPDDVVMMDVKRENTLDWSCKLCEENGTPFVTAHERAAKGHVSRKHLGAKFEMIMVPRIESVTEQVPAPIMPMHMSRMHQPSGELRK